MFLKINLLMKYLFGFLILLSSCSSQYVCYVRSNSITSDTTKLTYENDTLKINYNMWANGGKFSFTITNKLNVPIYIDWKKSSLIVGNTSIPYWQDEDKINSNSSGININKERKLSMSNTQSNGVIIHLDRITFIAPLSNFDVNGFDLSNFTYWGFNEKNGIKDQKKNITTWTYTNSNTPLVLRNFITYSLTEKMEKELRIDQSFFIFKVLLMPQKEFQYMDQNNKWVSPYMQTNAFYYTQ